MRDTDMPYLRAEIEREVGRQRRITPIPRQETPMSPAAVAAGVILATLGGVFLLGANDVFEALVAGPMMGLGIILSVAGWLK